MRYVLAALLLIANIAVADPIREGIDTIRANTTLLTPPLWAAAFEDDAATTNVIAAYGADGTANVDTDVLNATGKLGNAFDFYVASSSNYVDTRIGGTNIFASKPITFSAWIQPDAAPSGDARIFGNSSSARGQLRLTTAGAIYWSYDNTIATANGVVTIDGSTWTHVAVTMTATDEVVIYVNGAAAITGTAVSASLAPAGTVLVGDNSDGLDSFDGRIDDPRIYTVALTADEVNLIYNAGLGTTKYNLSSTSWFDASADRVTAPTGAWALDDNAASTTVVGTFGLDGTTAGALTSAMTDAGKVGTSLYIDGTTNRLINIADDAIFDEPNTITAAAWLKNDNTLIGINQYAFGKYNSIGDQREWSIRYTATTEKPGIAFGNPADGTYFNAVECDAPGFDAAVWNHVAFVFDNGTVHCFVNGVDVPTSGSAPATLFQGTSNMAIGGVASSVSWDGHVDSIRFYKRALSAKEIAELYNEGNGTAGGSAVDGNIQVDASGNLYSWASKVSSHDFYQTTTAYRPAIAAWKNRRCIDFDGTDDGLTSDILGSDLLDSTDGTVIALLETDSSTTAQTFVQDSDSGWFLRQNANGLLGYYSNDGSADEALVGIAPNVPYIVEATYDGTNLGVVVNGQTMQTDASDQLTLGGVVRIGQYGSADFNGRLCELITFDKYLSAADRYKIRRYLQRKWNLHTHTIPKPYIHMMAEDTAASTDLVNAMDSGVGVLSDNADTLTSVGKLGNAIEFTASTQYADVPLPSYLTGTGHTQCIWLYVTGSAASDRYIGGGNGAPGRLGTGDNVNYAIYDGSNWVGTTHTIDLDTWSHLCVRRNSTTSTTVFKNGVGQDIATAAYSATSGTYLSIGYQTSISSAGFTGRWDDFRSYGVPLTDADITWLYNGGVGRAESTY